MNKKIIILAITGILLLTVYTPVSSAAKLDIKGFFKTDPIITAEPDEDATNKLIMPLGETLDIPVKVNYKIEGNLAKLYSKIPLRNKKASLDFEIIDTPSYATASIDVEKLDFNISTESVEKEIILKVSLDEKATAFEKSNIDIKISANEVKGFLGLATLVNSGNITVEVPFSADYYPDITIDMPYDEKEIPPNNITEVPINITNNGNYKTTVLIDIKDIPVNWTLDIQNVDLNKDETKEIILEVDPYLYFDNETVKIDFTPQAYNVADKTGDTITKEILFRNDGSYVEEEEEEEGFFIPGFELVLLISALAACMIILKRRKK